MRLLIDNNLSPRLVPLLPEHDVEHVRDVGLSAASDVAVLDYAARTSRVLVSADTDFGALLAMSGDRAPSVVLLRRQSNRRTDEIAALLTANLPTVSSDLSSGALVVFGVDDMRVRQLPVRRRY